jgi:hypothetical protein
MAQFEDQFEHHPELPFQRHSETSRDAAEQALPSAGTQRRAVYDALLRHARGLTDEQQQELLRMNPSTQRPRRIELVATGRVIDSGETRPTRSGRKAVIWKAVPVAVRS